MPLDDRYQLEFRLYPYARSSDQDATVPVRHPVVVMGGGPVGMATALDLALKGVPVVVLDDHEGAGQGSRAICFAKRSLEIAHRLGCAAPMVDKGVVWNLGKVFHGDRKIYDFNLLPEDGHRFPAFINLQQPYFEKLLVDRVRAAQAAGAPIEIRGRNRVDAVEVSDDHATLSVTTPDGPYRLQADWLIGCDGASSPLRRMLGLDFEGRVFEDSFLIADIRMRDGTFPTERWFWFEPPFEDAGASILLHRQPDDVWRVDFQIGWDVDRTEELKEANVRRRLDAMLGAGVDYELVWTSIYTFQCRRMSRFRHGPVIFAGDSAHQVSPFGARGANSGMQDADNLGWKLALVIDGAAPARLLDSYHEERAHAADENILNSTRATDFITPKSKTSHLFRNAVLALAEDHAFARPLVNSGRLSVPCSYDGLSLTGDDALPGGPVRSRPGAPCPDAPLSGAHHPVVAHPVVAHPEAPPPDLPRTDANARDANARDGKTPDGNAPDGNSHDGNAPDGNAQNAQGHAGYLLDFLGGAFTLLTVDADAPALHEMDGVALRRVAVSVRDDPTGSLAERYLGDAPGAVYLIRPDQHVAARWDRFDEAALRQALRRACAKDDPC